jgi:toxin-antitoxin system PIN domain toxin
MILIDANILLYAEDSLNPLNPKAVKWMDHQLSGDTPVCFCWLTINAYLRISTNRRIFSKPLSISQAAERPCVKIIHPTDGHWKLFKEIIVGCQASANLVPDAHLAALAMGHGCVLCSTDMDFARFPKLKWQNPLK